MLDSQSAFLSSVRFQGFVRRVILTFAGITGLNDKVPTVLIQTAPVQHEFRSARINLIPVSHKPVLIVADKQVGHFVAEEIPRDSLTRLKAGNNPFEQIALIILAAEDVLVRPCVPVGDGFPPRRAADQLSESHTHISVLVSWRMKAVIPSPNDAA